LAFFFDEEDEDEEDDEEEEDYQVPLGLVLSYRKQVAEVAYLAARLVLIVANNNERNSGTTGRYAVTVLIVGNNCHMTRVIDLQ
jgi:hypothetical protein